MSTVIYTPDFISKIDMGESINQATIIGQVDFLLKIQNKKIEIIECTFKNNVSIKSFKSQELITFQNCTFSGSFELADSCELSKIQFTNCKFDSRFTISTSKIGQLILKETYCKYGLESKKMIFDSLNIETTTSDRERFLFSDSSIDFCLLSKLKDASEFAFVGVVIAPTNSIGFFHYNADAQFSGTLMLANCQFKTWLINGFNKSARIMVVNVKLDSLSCAHFTNTGSVSVSGMTAGSKAKIDIQHTNLGKCEIFDSDFSLFESVKLSNSNIQDIVPTNVVWCKRIECDSLDKIKSSHLRETYRQLKNVMIRHNDKIQELKYHELEMDSYLDQISKEKSKWADRFILWSNKVSNNHGLSWTKPLLILLLIGLFVFNLNKWLLGYNYMNPSLIPKDFGNFIESLNPIRKFDLVYTTYKNGWMPNVAFLLDVLFRILASYLIFQFISAFRKYVKK